MTHRWERGGGARAGARAPHPCPQPHPLLPGSATSGKAGWVWPQLLHPPDPCAWKPDLEGLGVPEVLDSASFYTVSQPLPLTPIGIQDGVLRSPPQGPAQGRWQGRSRLGRASASFLESAYWSLPWAFNDTWFTERAKVCKAWRIRHTPGVLFSSPPMALPKPDGSSAH